MILVNENNVQEHYSACAVDQMKSGFGICVGGKVQYDQFESGSPAEIIDMICLVENDQETCRNRAHEETEKADRYQ